MTPFNSFIISILFIGIIGVLFLLGRSPDFKVGQVISDAYQCVNGVCEYYYKVSLRPGTNTPCSIKSPEATSTIVHASMDLRTVATSSMGLEIGWGKHNNATTTSLASSTLPANTRTTLIATSTINGYYPFTVPLTNHIIPGSTNATNTYWVNFRFGTPSGYSSSITGNCEVIFRTVS